MKLGGGARAAGWAVAGIAVGSLVGWGLTLLLPEVYTSKAAVRIVPAMIPERFAPLSPELTLETMLPNVAQSILTRNSLVNLIHTYDLYPEELKREPLEDVIEFMQKQIAIRPMGKLAIEIVFSNPDAAAAQKVCRRLMTSIVDDTVRQRSSNSKMTEEFLKEQAADAGRHWEEMMAGPVPAGPAGLRLQLDRDLAKRRYEELTAKVNEARIYVDVETRKQGSTLEVLDLPSLPEHPDPVLGMTREVIMGLFGLAGLIVSVVTLWVRRARPVPVPAPIPMEAPLGT